MTDRRPLTPAMVAEHRAAPLADGVFVVSDSETGDLQYFWQDERPHIKVRAKPTRLPDNPEAPEFTVALLAARREAGVPLYPGHTPRNGMGYVYFMAVGSFVKIGFSRNPAQRLTDVRRAAAAEFDAYVVIPGALALEKTLHREFAAHRSNGEWFHRCKAIDTAMASAAIGKLKIGGLP